MRKLTSFLNPVLWAKTLQLVLLVAITTAMLGAGQSRYERLGHELVCSCGCGQILLECNHVSCPSSPVMIRELQAQLASGLGDTAVMNWFAGKYGATVLAAPIRGGFDNAAWIVPIGVFLLATAGTFGVVWIWKRRASALAPAPAQLHPAGFQGPEESALRERIRRETEY